MLRQQTAGRCPSRCDSSVGNGSLYHCLNSWTDSGNWLARTSEIRYPKDNLYFFPSASLPRLPGAVSEGTVIASGPCVLPAMIGLFGTVS